MNGHCPGWRWPLRHLLFGCMAARHGDRRSGVTLRYGFFSFDRSLTYSQYQWPSYHLDMIRMDVDAECNTASRMPEGIRVAAGPASCLAASSLQGPDCHNIGVGPSRCEVIQSLIPPSFQIDTGSSSSASLQVSTQKWRLLILVHQIAYRLLGNQQLLESG